MDREELRQALVHFDATLRKVEAQAGRGLDDTCERMLDAHRRVLVHLLDQDAAGLVFEAVKAAKRALLSDEPAAELQEIQIARHSIERMIARQADVHPS